MQKTAAESYGGGLHLSLLFMTYAVRAEPY